MGHKERALNDEARLDKADGDARKAFRTTDMMGTDKQETHLLNEWTQPGPSRLS